MPPEDAQEKPVDFSKLSLRETIQHSVKEIHERPAAVPELADEAPAAGDAPDKTDEKGRVRDEAGRFAKVDKTETPADTEPQPDVKPEATPSEPPPPATTAKAAPSSWSSVKHSLFASAPSDLQDYILQREQEMQEGVRKLKEGYGDIDRAVDPYKDMIRQYGQTPAQAIRSLLEWNTALASPYKEEAFRQLAQRFQIDLSRLAPQQQLSPDGMMPQGVPDPMQPVLQDLQSWQGRVESQLAQTVQQQMAAQQAAAEIQVWSKDKPHFEQVRHIMQDLVAMDQRAMQDGGPRYGAIRPDGQVDLDATYRLAVSLHPELGSQAQAADLARREEELRAKARAEVEAEAKAKAKLAQEAARAKSAAVSLKPGTAGAVGRAGDKTSHGESVRDTLRRSLKELD